MGWLLETDKGRRHIGAALGYLGEDDRAPTYRHGRYLVERTWANGCWEGPAEGRPEREPDFLRAVCSCGWVSQYLQQPTEVPGVERYPHLGEMGYEEETRARWLAHALAATQAAPPADAAAAHIALRDWLERLARWQPQAALSLIRAVRDAANAAERTAVAHGRGHHTSWEDLAAAAGTTRQQLWRKYRHEEADPDRLEDIVVPAYQHTPGQLTYAVTDIDLEEKQ